MNHKFNIKLRLEARWLDFITHDMFIDMIYHNAEYGGIVEDISKFGTLLVYDINVTLTKPYPIVYIYITVEVYDPRAYKLYKLRNLNAMSFIVGDSHNKRQPYELDSDRGKFGNPFMTNSGIPLIGTYI